MEDGKGQEEEPVPYHLAELREDLRDWFQPLHERGAFVMQRVETLYPTPALKIDNIGTIGLPLSDRDAILLKETAHKAPFGRGEETLIDESVRKTWEINMDKVHITNPQWPSWIHHHVVPQVVSALGLGQKVSRIRVEPYKMLLYEAGCMFKPHQDSEKAPGMFGSLVISLPSEHTGGDVILQHRNDQAIWSSAIIPPGTISYAAWYSDVVHSVSEVSSGYRLALTYNLIHIPSDNYVESPSAAALEPTHLKLQKILARWEKELELGWNNDKEDYDFMHATLMLEHEYTEPSLRLDCLKGSDRVVVEEVLRTCAHTNFTILLAQLELDTNGPASHKYCYVTPDQYKQECSKNLTLKSVFDFTGLKIASEFSACLSSVVPENYFDHVACDGEETEYTGNAGANKTMWYCKSAMLIIPRDRINSIVLGPALQRREKLTTALQHYYNGFQSAREAIEPRKMMEDVLWTCLLSEDIRKRARGHWLERYSLDADVVWLMLVMSADAGLEACFRCCLEQLEQPPHLEFYAQIGAVLREAFFDLAQESLQHAIQKQTGIGGRLDAMETFKRGFQSQGPGIPLTFQEKLESWSTTVLQQMLSEDLPSLGKGNGAALFDVGKRMGVGTLINTVIPFAVGKVMDSNFMMNFLAPLMEYAGSRSVAEEHRDRLRQEVSKLLRVMTPKLQSTYITEKANPHVYSRRSEPPTVKVRTPIDIRSATTVYRELLKQPHFENDATIFLQRFVEDAEHRSTKNHSFYGTLLFTFLNRVMQTRKEQSFAPFDDLIQRLTIMSVQSCLQNHLQAEPKPPPDYVESGYICTRPPCQQCIDARPFLIGFDQKEVTIHAAKARLEHLEHSVVGSEITCEWIRPNRSRFALLLKRKEPSYERALAAYQIRLKSFTGKLDVFNQQDLMQVLGDAYERIAVRRDPDIPGGTPLQETSANARAVANGTQIGISSPEKSKATSSASGTQVDNSPKENLAVAVPLDRGSRPITPLANAGLKRTVDQVIDLTGEDTPVKR